MPRMYISWQITINTSPRPSRDCKSQGVAGACKVLLILCRRPQIDGLQISLIKYVLNSRLNKDRQSNQQPDESTAKVIDLFRHGHTRDVFNSPIPLGRAMCNRNATFKQHRMIETSSTPGRWHQLSVDALFDSTHQHWVLQNRTYFTRTSPRTW